MTNAKQIEVRVPPPLYKDIDSLANEWGLSLSETAMYILKWYVDYGPVREFMSEEERENRAQLIKARLPVYAGLGKTKESKKGKYDKFLAGSEGWELWR